MLNRSTSSTKQTAVGQTIQDKQQVSESESWWI